MLGPRHQAVIPDAPVDGLHEAECRVLDTLWPGSSTTAVLVKWDLTDAEMEELSESFTVYDYWFEPAESDEEHTNKGRHFRLKGELLKIKMQPGTDRWVANDPDTMLQRNAKVTGGTLTADSSQTVTFYHGDPSNYDLSDTNKLDGVVATDIDDVNVTVTAHYRWITPIVSIAQNSNVVVEYKPDWYRWDIVDNECA